MKFDALNDLIPHVVGKKNYVVTMQPYNAITLAMPGKHQKDTPVPGADYVVMVDDSIMDWARHKFTHVDLFLDLEIKSAHSLASATSLMDSYLSVIHHGTDPEKITHADYFPGLHSKTFLYAVQCLAVAEHRRYAKWEKQGGGRFLPFRFSAGIVEGLWTATEAADKQKWGRPAVERLEREKGVPDLTKQLLENL